MQVDFEIPECLQNIHTEQIDFSYFFISQIDNSTLFFWMIHAQYFHAQD